MYVQRKEKTINIEFSRQIYATFKKYPSQYVIFTLSYLRSMQQSSKSSSFRIALLVSGSGTNAEKIQQHCKDSKVLDVAFWACNRREAGAYERAAQVGAEIIHLSDLNDSNGVFAKKLRSERVDGIVLAGFLQLIPEWLIDKYPEKIINIHPSLLPKFGGKGMYGLHVHRAVISSGETDSGITIHLVNQAFDEGRILYQFKCPVEVTDTPEDLAKRIQRLEHAHFARCVHEYFLGMAHSEPLNDE